MKTAIEAVSNFKDDIGLEKQTTKQWLSWCIFIFKVTTNTLDYKRKLQTELQFNKKRTKVMSIQGYSQEMR